VPSVTEATAATSLEDEEREAPPVWKSNIHLPPPLFSPLLHQATTPHAATAAPAAIADARFFAHSNPPSTHCASNVPPILQPDLPSFDEQENSEAALNPHPRTVRLQRRLPCAVEAVAAAPHRHSYPHRSGSVGDPSSSPASRAALVMPTAATTLGWTALESSTSSLPPPMPLISSPSPSPTVGPRRTLRMRKADAIELGLP
jgi:hypothetical protein